MEDKISLLWCHSWRIKSKQTKPECILSWVRQIYHGSINGVVLSNTTNSTRQHCDLDHLHALVQPSTNGWMFVFVRAQFINFMEALNTTALNFLLFWYLSKVHGLYLACRSCAGAVTVQEQSLKQSLLQHPQKPKIVHNPWKQTASHPSKFTRRAGFCKRFS